MAEAIRWLMAISIAIIIGISALSFVPDRASAITYWDWSMDYDVPYLDQITSFYVHVQNQGTVSLDIWNYSVHFDWDPSTNYTLVGSTHVTIAAGGAVSPQYSIEVRIPLTAGTGIHTISQYCTGQWSDQPSNTTNSWSPTFTVLDVPTLGVTTTGAFPDSGTVPLTVHFNSAVAGGLKPYTYSWTFGDGGTSTSAAPSHNYTTVGTFIATVIVNDTETVIQITSASTIIVTTWPGLAATGTAFPVGGFSPLYVNFTCTPVGGDGVYNYSWDFGDQSDANTSQNTTHQYSNAGKYTVTVTVTDTASHSAQWSKVITVWAAAPSTFQIELFIGILTVIAIIGAYVVMSRRKKAGEQGPTPPQNP